MMMGKFTFPAPNPRAALHTHYGISFQCEQSLLLKVIELGRGDSIMIFGLFFGNFGRSYAEALLLSITATPQVASKFVRARQ